jgi:ABC-2 type transport system ATP-binding protein
METRDLIKGLAGSHTIVLSTHILPEVSQTCQRVVIINKGKVVAVDTPEALTDRLQGAHTYYLQVDAPPGTDVGAALLGVPGVSRVTAVDQKGPLTGFDVECLPGEDRRRELARLVVTSQWGLLELRPTRLTLEEIFLQLTTDDRAAAAETPAKES